MPPQFGRRTAAALGTLAAAGMVFGPAGASARTHAHPHSRSHVKRFHAAGYPRVHARLARADTDRDTTAAASAPTATPLKHIVVIFQENVSFDHYFATYPHAVNPRLEPAFQPAAGTPTVNGLNTPLLQSQNPNSVQPFRLDRSQAATCDQDHDYRDEQVAFDHGLMDLFPETVGASGGSCADFGFGKNLVMGYYDGNTVTGLWNYAQHFAMSDNSFNTTFGPSTPGAINLVSGQTHGVTVSSGDVTNDLSADGQTIEGDPQPYYDGCSTRETVGLSGRNIGDLMNRAGITWGWFQGGFRPTGSDSATGKPVCASTHTGADGNAKSDYIPHHEPFQYYASTANPNHLPPTSPTMVGTTDQANHQYDLSDFWSALDRGVMPAVSFLKAPGYQDGHAGYSSPLLEQQFLAETINRLESKPQWKNTAVLISYDDSDGWYDHQMSPIVNQSQDTGNGPNVGDALTGPNQCGTKAPAGGYQGRCGYGPRLPLLVVSPWAKSNFVDHSTTDQTSILQAIEQNWGLPSIGDASFDQRAGSLIDMFDFSGSGNNPALKLDPWTGQPTTP